MAETGEVQLHFLDYWRVVKNRWGIITLTFLLVVITAFITTHFLEPKYTSQVTIEVKSDARPINVNDARENDGENVDPHFVANQLKRLQSKGIIYPVIDRLDLTKKWSVGQAGPMSKENAFYKLLGMMRGLQEVRNTDFLIVPVTSPDPKEAADIANTIASVYLQKRLDDKSDMIDKALAELNDEVGKQRDKVDKAWATAQEVRDRLGIIDRNPEDFGTAGEQMPVIEDNAEQAKLHEAQQRVEELKSQQAKIENMPLANLMGALTLLGITDESVSKILQSYQDLVAQDAQLSESLGPQHPKLITVRSEEVTKKKQLDDALKGIKTNLQIKLDIAQNYLASEQKIYDDAHAKAMKSSSTNGEYLTAKQNYIAAKKLLNDADMRLVQERMAINITWQPAEIWDKAEPASGPSSPNVPFLMIVAVFAGLGMGIGLAFFLEYLDTSVKTLADVEKFIGVSVLAVVPKIGGLLHKADEGHSPDAETYRTLRTNIDFHKPSPDANTLTVISGGPGEGKSTTLCNLAVICANAGSNVLVVDADLRRPTQHKFFDLDGSIGLVNYVNGDKEFEDIIQQTPVENLWLIPAGSTTKDPVAILSSHRLVEFIARAKTQFDFVLFDSPPILGLSDGSVLSSIVEMTVMVVQHRRFPRASLLRVKQAVLNVGGNLIGVVLNRVDTRDDANYYYYTSYYDYYSPIPPESKAKSKADI